MIKRIICRLQGHHWTKRERPILHSLDDDGLEVTVFGDPVRCTRCGRTAA